MHSSRMVTLGMALPGLFALGLACAPPAHAQTLFLQSGDNVSVSAGGTHGVYQGFPINNATSTYNAGELAQAVRATRGSLFTLGSGGTLAGSSGGPGLRVSGGTVIINGGTVGGMNVVDGAVTINQGSISTSGLITQFGSTTTTIQINGGNFTSASSALALGEGTTYVTGGTFKGGPGQLGDFNLSFGAVLDLFGTFDGYSSGSMITSGSGTITGTLLDGETINNTYVIGQNFPGIIEFNVGPAPVPEASTTASFGLLLALGAGGLVIAARRKRAAVKPSAAL